MPMLFHKTWDVILERSQSVFFNICILGGVLMLENLQKKDDSVKDYPYVFKWLYDTTLQI